MRTVAKVLFACLCVVVVVLALVWALLVSSLPPRDAVVSVSLGRTGINSDAGGGRQVPPEPYPLFPGDRIKITRDRYGIPTIRASDVRDAAYALGYVHARDRLWQMEMVRRLGTGRQSEIFGGRTLAADRFMRTLGLEELCAGDLAASDAEVKYFIRAYTDGVNQFLRSRRGALPPEFLVYAHDPEPWRDTDTLLLGRLLALWQSQDWVAQIYRGALGQLLEPRQLQTLWPDLAEPPDGDATWDTSHAVRMAGVAGQNVRGWLALLGELEESRALPRVSGNLWAASGSKTTSGLPLVAGDFHGDDRVPAHWYLVRIETPEGTLSGGTLPGFPFVLTGQNDDLAFGLNGSASDTAEVLVERSCDPDGRPQAGPQPDPRSGPVSDAVSDAGSHAGAPDIGSDNGFATHYLDNGRVRAFSVREERIRVRFSPDEVLRVRSSRNGVIVSDGIRLPRSGGWGPVGPLALRSSALAPGSTLPEALYRLNRARSVAEVHSAARFFSAPHWTVVYATRDGRIGRLDPAASSRQHALRAVPFAPRPGWLAPDDPGRHGFRLSDGAPADPDPDPVSIPVPAQDFVLSTNDPPPWTGKTPAPSFGQGMSGQARALRLAALLEEARALDVPAAGRILDDRFSPALASLLPLMLRFSPDFEVTGSRSIAAAHYLLSSGGWGYRMDPERLEPLLAVAWLHELNDALFGGIPGRGRPFRQPFDPGPVVRVLAADGFWCREALQDARSESPQDTCGPLLRETLLVSLARLNRENPGMDLFTQGRRDRVQRSAIHSGALEGVPVLGRLAHLSLPPAGGLQSLDRRGGDEPHDGFFPVAGLGSGLRVVLDPARADNSRYAVVPGQSGHFLSPAYRNQVALWASGQLIGMDSTDTSGGTTVLRPVSSDDTEGSGVLFTLVRCIKSLLK
ncbi:penicillin acylase family protein [Phaeovibrio sulfidiphilus]|uniref:Penicillin acylase family protein n=1 Tax=Phaeovibrio sulfidiphilus TaxID=1220600 RepID=A0A8J6Z0D6_9PROT|nr:penicillin acylase family protein [Phaeovibrio sulfidiphilus]MBE1237643.1 penicillin acylase family protein [Phaeovibrio sulfidiphilus]